MQPQEALRASLKSHACALRRLSFNATAWACRSDWGFLPIVKYGEEWAEPRGRRSARRPVKLLYTGSNHYDLLL